MEGYIVTKIKLSEERLREYTQDEEELREIKHRVVVVKIRCVGSSCIPHNL